jgi:hypothetical protein
VPWIHARDDAKIGWPNDAQTVSENIGDAVVTKEVPNAGKACTHL